MLASRLKAENIAAPFVIAIPRGGVIIAAEIASVLGAPLDVAVSRKLGLPDQPELGFGAVAPDGIMVLNEDVVYMANLRTEDIERVRKVEENELKRRVATYRANIPPLDLAGRDVILVDDGIATGITAKATIAYLRTFAPNSIILASPVASTEAAKGLKDLVEKEIFLEVSSDFYGVGQFYRDFPQVTDSEVINILRGYNRKVTKGKK